MSKKEAARKLLRLHGKLDKLLGESNQRVSKFKNDPRPIEDNKIDDMRFAMEQDRADLLSGLLTDAEEIILQSMEP